MKPSPARMWENQSPILADPEYSAITRAHVGEPVVMCLDTSGDRHHPRACRAIRIGITEQTPGC